MKPLACTRKVAIILAILFTSHVILGQESKSKILLNPDVIPMTYHGKTVPLRDFVADPNFPNEITKTEKLGYHAKKHWKLNDNINPNALPQGLDPALQSDYAREAGERDLTINYNGMGYTNVNPADPSLDVGPNHVIQMINGSSGAYFRVYDKDGTPLIVQTYLDNYFGFPGGAGDPIVVYDAPADRWLMSEFISGGNQLSVAVSETPDPLGAWNVYSFNTPNFPDYPKYSIWNNAYIVTTNENTSAVYALNRTAMLAGNAATAQRFTMNNFGTIGFQAAAPVNLDGTTLPPTGTAAMVMRMRDDAWTGAASDALEIWNFNINWTTPANTSLQQAQVLPVTAFSTNLCGYTSFSCVPQPGSSIELDPLREVLMNRVHYRNFGTHESIVCCHVVDVDGNDRHGIRWYELRRTNGTSGIWSIYQQGTYSPDAVNRWMPSICISASGNIGLAYNVSSGTVFPGLRYTGRKSCDPLGTMTEPETVIIAGSAANGSNRYGDYNSMGLDPEDGETFWFTGKYNVNSGWSTRIAAFNIDPCNASVQFSSSTSSTTEASAAIDGTCGDYTVLNVPVQIGGAPSADATVQITVNGGSAIEGVDYNLISQSVTLGESALNGNIVIHVLNDALLEGNETIVLGYTLNANGGNAIEGAINQTMTITINDDDVAPTAATNSALLYSQNFQAGFGDFTTTNPSGNTAWQVGNAAAASTTAFTVPNTNNTQFAWINDDACNCNQNNVSLLFPILDFSNVESGMLTFDSYFESNTYQGNTETAILRVSINNGPFATMGSLVASETGWVEQSFNVTPYAGQASVRFSIVYSDGTGWLYGCAIDNVEINVQTNIGIQTAVNTSTETESSFGSVGAYHFYDNTSGDVMATIQNQTAEANSCVSVSVDRSGENPGALLFFSNNIPDYVTSKTYRVVSTGNFDGEYLMTLYYEEAEVAAWEAATGNSRNDIQMIRVADAASISAVTPANYTTYDITAVPVTIGAFNDDVTFTAGFSGSFGAFTLGIIPEELVAPQANFDWNESEICQGETISFTDLSAGSPTTWIWSFGDGEQSNEQNPTHTYTESGEYSVSLTVTNSVGFNTTIQSDIIVVNTNPQPVLTVPFAFESALGPNTVCLNFTPDQLEATPTGGVFAGEGVTGNTLDVSNFAAEDVIALTYTYTDANGCTGTDIIEIVLDICASVDAIQLTEVNIYPNPSAGIFEVKGLEVGQPLVIYDEAGRKVYETKVAQTQLSLDLQKYAAGNYFLHTTVGDKTGSVKLIIHR
jgi:PKD repeat protein